MKPLGSCSTTRFTFVRLGLGRKGGGRVEGEIECLRTPLIDYQVSSTDHFQKY